MGQGLLDAVFAGENGLGNTLVNLFGGSGDRLASITYATGRTYNKETMVETGSAETSYTCDMTPPTNFTKEQIDGTQIRVDDLQTVVPAFQVPEEPPSKATLEYDSRKYTIVKVWRIISGNKVCNYRLQLRSI